MAFAKWLREHAANASPEQRLALYDTLRARIDQIDLNDHAHLKGSAGQYRAQLESDIRDFEAEQATLDGNDRVDRIAAPSVTTPERAVDSPPQSAPTNVAAKSRSMVPALFIGAAIGCSALLGYQAVTRSPMANMAQAYDAGLASTDANVALLRELKGALEQHASRTRGFPLAPDTWRPLAPVAAALPELARLLDKSGAAKDKFLYRGTASDYKLILHHSGDCFIVRLRSPELVDPIRAAGSVDCYAYGFWTNGAANW